MLQNAVAWNDAFICKLIAFETPECTVYFRNVLLASHMCEIASFHQFALILSSCPFCSCIAPAQRAAQFVGDIGAPMGPTKRHCRPTEPADLVMRVSASNATEMKYLCRERRLKYKINYLQILRSTQSRIVYVRN